MDRELALLNRAAGREGLITRADALKLVTKALLRWRLKTKRWGAVWPGVYSVAGVPQTRARLLLSVQLWLGRGFAFSHATAAGLYRFRGYENEGDPIVTISRRLRRHRGLVAHRVWRLAKEDVTKRGDLPVTTVERTVFDVAPTETNLKALVDDLLARRLTTVDKLELALRRLDPRGRSPLWKLLHAYQGGDAPTESELERLVLELIEKAGLPLPIKQKVLFIAGRMRRIDFLYEVFGVVIEADGYVSHSTTEAFESDRERGNDLSVQGLTTLHWTWKALKTRPEKLIAQLKSVLISRGWVPNA